MKVDKVFRDRVTWGPLTSENWNTLVSSAEENLSPREVEVAELAAHGHRIAEIAELLFISRDTAKTHLKSIFRKLEVHNRAELAAKWFKNVSTSGERTRRQSAPPALVPPFIVAGVLIATLLALSSSNASRELKVSAVESVDSARSADAGTYPISPETGDCRLVWIKSGYLVSCPR